MVLGAIGKFLGLDKFFHFLDVVFWIIVYIICAYIAFKIGMLIYRQYKLSSLQSCVAKQSGELARLQAEKGMTVSTPSRSLTERLKSSAAAANPDVSASAGASS